jgi:hypothetical protein
MPAPRSLHCSGNSIHSMLQYQITQYFVLIFIFYVRLGSQNKQLFSLSRLIFLTGDICVPYEARPTYKILFGHNVVM